LGCGGVFHFKSFLFSSGSSLLLEGVLCRRVSDHRGFASCWWQPEEGDEEEKKMSLLATRNVWILGVTCGVVRKSPCYKERMDPWGDVGVYLPLSLTPSFCQSLRSLKVWGGLEGGNTHFNKVTFFRCFLHSKRLL